MFNTIFSKKILLYMLLVLLATIGMYYIIDRSVRYTHFTEASYTTYFWPRRYWLFVHLIVGTMALITGPAQFIKKLRQENVRLHRRLGYIYLSAIWIGSVAGFYMALTSHINLMYKAGLTTLAIVWCSSASFALWSILRRNISQHREWMIRSYVLTFSFISFRMLADTMLYYKLESYENILGIASWACWAVPLYVTEVILQARKVFFDMKISKRKMNSTVSV